ncbi:uncharacterized protein LOC129562507 [Moschus berezovskii]|uniref:uncharacterized protein LOC129562507 n=1 Tax=Moschus berezovskii TaxID=68408 RepID=UPI002443C72C|nr:uncharacterized protein LOC129562507 [Moschus berezovskii]
MHGQADTQHGGVPASSPQGRSPCLSCRNPRRGRRWRTARAARPPPLSGRSTSERGRRSDSGDSERPHPSSLHSSACSPGPSPEQLLGELGGTSVACRTAPLPPGTHSKLAPSPWGRCTFPHRQQQSFLRYPEFKGTPFNQPKLTAPVLPAVWPYSWAWRESPQNKTLLPVLLCLELCNQDACAVLLCPLPWPQHLGVACVAAVLGPGPEVRPRCLCLHAQILCT